MLPRIDEVEPRPQHGHGRAATGQAAAMRSRVHPSRQPRNHDDSDNAREVLEATTGRRSNLRGKTDGCDFLDLDHEGSPADICRSDAIVKFVNAAFFR